MARYQEPQDYDIIGELYRRGDNARRDIRTLQNRKHLGVWINPTFLNGWGNAGGTYQPFQYRKVFNDTLQVRGVITGGATGSVVCVIPLSHRPVMDSPVIGAVISGTFKLASLLITAADGNATISFA